MLERCSVMQGAVVQHMAKAVGAVAVGAWLALAAPASQARGPLEAAPQDAVTLAELPAQARTTYRLILSGGPFPFDKDGTVFGNRERLLPAAKRGYYREYTVKTPWSRDRGARRIVCGGQPPTQPHACYYTSDHYNSFRKITP
jgi:ribonuclease T1